MLIKLLTALAVLGLSATAAVATDSGTEFSDDVITSEVTESPSPDPSESPDPTGTPDPTFTPDPTPTPDVSGENVPNGKAYGWWRNRGVILDKPGNGPKPNDHAGGGDEGTETEE